MVLYVWVFCLNFVLFGNKSHLVAQVGLDLTAILLPESPKCWNYRCVQLPSFLARQIRHFHNRSKNCNTEWFASLPSLDPASPPVRATVVQAQGYKTVMSSECSPSHHSLPVPLESTLLPLWKYTHGASVLPPLLFTLSLSLTLALHFNHRGLQGYKSAPRSWLSAAWHFPHAYSLSVPSKVYLRSQLPQ